MDGLNEWPCQQLLGGTGASIYENVDGMCTHPECHPKNDDRAVASPNKALKSDTKNRCPRCDGCESVGYLLCRFCGFDFRAV